MSRGLIQRLLEEVLDGLLGADRHEGHTAAEARGDDDLGVRAEQCAFGVRTRETRAVLGPFHRLDRGSPGSDHGFRLGKS